MALDDGLRLLRLAGLRAAEFVGAGLVLIGVAPLWVLPWRASQRLGRTYGRIGCLCWGPGRRAGLINMRRAFGPSMTRATATVHVGEVFAAMGASIAEGMQFARRHRTGRGDWPSLYEAEDPALEAGILARPGPKIFVTAHLGSWEVALMIAGLRIGPRGAVIVRRIDNPFLNAVIERLRPSGGAQMIEKREAIARAHDALTGGHSVAMLIDEDGGPRGPFVPFFGRLASTRKTPALLSMITGTPIVVGAAVRRPGRPFLYRLALIEPPSPDQAGAVQHATRQITATLEAWIRDMPWQWRWIHWRWRTRPDGSRERYTGAAVRAVFAEGSSTVSDRAAKENHS